MPTGSGPRPLLPAIRYRGGHHRTPPDVLIAVRAAAALEEHVAADRAVLGGGSGAVAEDPAVLVAVDADRGGDVPGRGLGVHEVVDQGVLGAVDVHLYHAQGVGAAEGADQDHGVAVAPGGVGGPGQDAGGR